jgi:hypothetical protein
MKTLLPPLPFSAWRPAKETLHLWTQIVGKIRMALAPPRNHWWHVTLRVSPRGFTTGLIPHKAGAFEVEFDLVDHGVEVRTPGGSARFPLRDGLSVAEFHRELLDHLATFGIRPSILAKPYDVPFSKVPFAKDRRHASYDPDAAARYGAVLRWAAPVLERFAGRFEGKTSPVQLFWHSLDLAVTRFSGRRAPPMPGANKVTQEAYSHEVASFGFWAGDNDTREPSFYGYAAPVPEGLRTEPLLPRAAKWSPGSGMARLPYEAVRKSADPAGTLTKFFESVHRAASKRARWADAEPPAVKA